jgi:Ca2+-binding EF-hand superfamily protein
LEANSGKIAIIVLSRILTSNDARLTDDELAQQLKQAISLVRATSFNLTEWQLDKVTVLDSL